jgi:hypothetical protein
MGSPMRKIAYNIKLRRQETGEVHDRLIFAHDEVAARARAISKARIALATTMVERKYGKFEVLSCVVAATS